MNVPSSRGKFPWCWSAPTNRFPRGRETGTITLKRLARLSDISFASEPPEKSVQIIVRGTVAALPLQGIIDFDAEKIRLAKEIGKTAGRRQENRGQARQR